MTATLVDTFDTRGFSAHLPLRLLAEFHAVIASPSAEAEVTPCRHAALTAFDRANLGEVEEIASMRSLPRSIAALSAFVADNASRPPAVVQAHFLLAFYSDTFDKTISCFVGMAQHFVDNDDLTPLPMPFASVVYCALVFLKCCSQEQDVRKNDNSRAAALNSVVDRLAALEKSHKGLCAAYCEMGAPLLLWFLAQTTSQRRSELMIVERFVGWVNGTIRPRNGGDAIGQHVALCSMALSMHLLEHGALRDASLLHLALDHAVKADIVLMGFLEYARSVVAFERLRRGQETHFSWRFDKRLDDMLVLRALHVASMKAPTPEAATSAHYDIFGQLGRSSLAPVSLPLEVVLEFEFAEAYGVRFGDGGTLLARAKDRASQVCHRPLDTFVAKAKWSRHWKWALDSLFRAFLCLDVKPLCPSVSAAFTAAAAAMRDS